MAFKIIWSTKAKSDLKKVVDYLESEWSHKDVMTFSKILIDRLELISNFPVAGTQVFDDADYRKIVLTKQNTMYYHTEESQIRILRIFDTRQHPLKLKLRIKK